MRVTKCDICKKVIDGFKEEVMAGQGWKSYSLCFTCGKPVINFLKKNKLWSEPGK